MAVDVKKWTQGTRDYVNELKLEMRRVTWPSRKQVESTTGVVIFSVFAFAAYFWVIDGILSKGVQDFLKFFTE
jgi:preprotein translocase subunit SecE